MAVNSPASPGGPEQDQAARGIAVAARLLKGLSEALGSVQGLVVAVGSLAATFVSTLALVRATWETAVIAGAIAIIITIVIVMMIRSRSRGEAVDASVGSREILSGLRPIERPPLPLRDGDIQHVLDMVIGAGFDYGALIGRPGSGKTSLIRAALLTRLKAEGYFPVYLPEAGADLLALTRTALLKTLAPEHVPTDTGPRALLRALSHERQQPVVVIYDQFDDFLLPRGEEVRQRKFTDWICKASKDTSLNSCFLFVLRDDVYTRMPDLVPSMPAASSITDRHELREFSPDDTSSVLQIVAVRQGDRLEPGLAQELVRDLTHRNMVSPTLLQIVAGYIKRWRITTLQRYRDDGEAPAILEGYVIDQIRGAADSDLARTLLERLAATVPGQPGGGRTLESLQETQNDLPDDEREAHNRQVATLLTYLVSARLVLQEVNGTYCLFHPILQPSVRSALVRLEAEKTPAALEAAALLHDYLVKFQADGRTRISVLDLFRIKRHVSVTAQREEPARTLLRKSSACVRIAGSAALGTFALVALATTLVMFGIVALHQTWVGPLGISPKGVSTWDTPSAVALHHESSRVAVSYKPEAPDPPKLFILNYLSGHFATLRHAVRWGAEDPVERHGTMYTALAFNSDGQILAAGDQDGNISLLTGDLQRPLPVGDVATRSPDPQCSKRAIEYLSYGTSPNRLVTAAGCGTVEIWDTSARPNLLGTRPLPKGSEARFVRGSTNGDLVAFIHLNAALPPRGTSEPTVARSSVMVWKLRSPDLINAFEFAFDAPSQRPIGLSFDQDDRLRVVFADDAKLKLRTFDRTGAVQTPDLELRDCEVEWTDVAMSRDSNVVVVSDAGRYLCIWDIPGDRTVKLEQSDGWIRVYLSSHGSELVLTRRSTNAVFAYGFHLLNRVLY